MNSRRFLYFTFILVFICVVSISYYILSDDNEVYYREDVNYNSYIGFVGDRISAIEENNSSKICSDLIITPTSISLDNILLTNEGDTCTYELEVKNDSDYDAYLNNIDVTKPDDVMCAVNDSSMVCDKVSYSLMRDDEVVSVGDRLSSYGSNIIKLIVKNNGSSTVTQSFAGFTLTYTQALVNAFDDDDYSIKAVGLDGDKLGNMIRIGDEDFYIIASDGVKVKALAKNNLDINTGVQYISDNYLTSGFSKYFNDNVIDITGAGYNYINSSFYDTLNKYQLYLNNHGALVKVELMTFDEANKLLEDGFYWYKEASDYWLGSYFKNQVYYVKSGNVLLDDYSNKHGIRPVIEFDYADVLW